MLFRCFFVFFAFCLLFLGEILNAQPLNLFILAGQSNMAGRGGVSAGKWDGYVPPACSPNRSVLSLNARLQWEPAREPLHADVDVNKTCGVGPGMAFANRIAPSESGPVGLVPCAVGGTKIKAWERGSELYEAMVRRAKAAAGGGGTIRALLWYQGESDTVSVADADSYRTHMESFIGDVRRDLNFPALPVIQVALASGEGKFIEKVREAQFGIHLPNVITVDAKGLSLNADHLHLTIESQVRLGTMLADAYLK